MQSLNKIKLKLISLSILLLFLTISMQSVVVLVDTNPSFIPPDISELQYTLPPGYHVGTFSEYIKENPYSNSVITSKRMEQTNQISLTHSISLLIKTSLYTKITLELDQYIQDLEDEGFYIINIDTLAGGNPEEVKQWVQNQYNAGALGVVFIGDIPAAWAEVSESVFPCDLFYMDLDGSWVDSNNDGVYESHTKGSGDMGPELYVGRLYASSLNWNTEEFMIADYLDKTHQYRTGSLYTPRRGLEYIDEDWHSMNVFLNKVYNDNISHYDFGYSTTAEDYLDKLSESQHFVQVCAHSWPGGHHFGRRPTEAVTYTHIYVHSPNQQQAKLLMGCDDGVIAWFNGEEILHKDVYTGWMRDIYKIDVTLNQGWNSLLCKVSQDNWDYVLSARFTDASYASLPDLTYRIDNPNNEGVEASFIRSWLVHGFHQDSSDRFYEYLSTNYLGVDEATVTPSEGQSMAGKPWVKYSSSSPFVDLDDYSDNADFGAMYAYVNIQSEQAVNCELWTGYDDGMKAWLNGEQILLDNRYGGYTVDMTKIPIQLQEGANHLVLKISEWMGGYGFSARICYANGDGVEGLYYTPDPEPVSYIGTWLVAGPFENEDAETRLITEYISDEQNLQPAVGDEYPGGTWQKAYGDGYPFDIAGFFNHGGWIYSQTIHDLDPPVLFYNLFSCGPGRFTDDNYLAGSYIFDTTYGLITVASAKSGSMLYFDDFYDPLGRGKTFGESFMDWFDAQAPFDLWEKEWYYGMVLCGDPTLTVFSSEDPILRIDISHPDNGIYISDSKVIPFFVPLIIGNITIDVDILNPGYGINSIEFNINDNLVFTDTEYPFTYVLNEPRFGKQTIEIVAEDSTGQISTKELVIWKFF